MKKNNTIQLWRFICSIAIVILHFNIETGFCSQKGYGKGLRLAVEFFFILSGFLLAHKMTTNAEVTPIMVLQGKLKKLYPHYLFSFLVLATVYALIDKVSVIKNIVSNFFEIILLQNAFRGTKEFVAYNEPAWYVAVLILASYIIAYLLKKNFSLYMEMIAPASVVLIYSYFIKYHGSISKWNGATEILNVDRLFLRGFAGISLGCLVYMAYRKFSEIEWKKWVCILADVVVNAGLLIVLIVSFYRYGGWWDIAIIAAYAILILLSFLRSQQSKEECRSALFSYLGTLSYAVYLNQELFRRVILKYVLHIQEWSIQGMAVYVIGLILYSMVTMWMVDKVTVLLFRQFGVMIEKIKRQTKGTR